MGFVLTTSALTASGIGGQDEPSTVNRADLREHISARRTVERLADDGGLVVVPVATPTVAPDARSAVSEPIPDATEIPEPFGLPVDPAPVEAALDGRAGLVQLVKQSFPDDESMWRHVVWAESIGDWNPNWECTVYGGCWSATQDCGLMQIHWSAHYDKFARHGWTQADCWIPEHNLQIAREIYDTSGPGAWTTYR